MGSLFLLNSCCEQAAAGMIRVFPVHFVPLQSNSIQCNVREKDIPVLMSAAQSEKLATMELLLNAGADINYVHDFNGSILNIATELGNFEMLKLAFRHGALINIMPIPKSYAPLIPNDCALRLLCASGQMWPFFTTKDMPNELVTEINEKSLRNFTCEAIRNHMIYLTNNNLFSQVERLPIPQLMKDYLLYNTSI